MSALTPAAWALAAGILVLNLPFGWWRAGTRRMSLPWFLAIHLPVPAVIAGRVLAGVGWHLLTFPVNIAAFFLGQYLGGRLRRRRQP